MAIQEGVFRYRDANPPTIGGPPSLHYYALIEDVLLTDRICHFFPHHADPNDWSRIIDRSIEGGCTHDASRMFEGFSVDKSSGESPENIMYFWRYEPFLFEYSSEDEELLKRYLQKNFHFQNDHDNLRYIYGDYNIVILETSIFGGYAEKTNIVYEYDSTKGQKPKKLGLLTNILSMHGN